MTKNILEDTLRQIKPQNPETRAKARARLECLTMPRWALGRLMDMAEDLAGMTGSLNPPVSRRVIVTMAGDHGVAREGVSLYPAEVTVQMVHNFARGGAGINALARTARAGVVIVDMGVAGDLSALEREKKIISRKIAPGTANILKGPAMTREQARRSVEAGIEIALDLAERNDVIGTGDMGIGNTTPSAAIAAVMTGLAPDVVAGRGTGLNEEQWKKKVAVIRTSLEVNRPDAGDPLDVLAKVGGFEIGGIVGLILGAAAKRKPVIVDGFISTAAALIARGLCPPSMDYAVASHLSEEQGHALMLKSLNKRALLDLNLRLGEGTGAALAMNLVEASARILTEVATFQEAQVSQAS